MYVPDQEIEKIIFRALDLEVKSISRFNSELSHCICDVETESKNIVVRISAPECFKSLEGSVYWLNELKKAGIRVPEVLYVNDNLEDFKYHFIIIERLEGCDLGYVYPEMTSEQKRDLACKMVEIKKKVAKISQSEIPGKKFLPTDKLKQVTWYDYLITIPEISDDLEDKSLFDVSLIHKYEEIALAYKELLNSVKIEAFLDEATIRNVMVNNGEFSGIIDIDYLNHGDSVKTIALTKMLLLKLDYDLHYVDFWCYEQGLTPEQYILLDIYTLRYCLKFMSNVGEIDRENSRLEHIAEIDRLKLLFNKLYKKLKQVLEEN